MKHIPLAFFAAAMLVVVAPSSTQAGTITFGVTLSGLNEVPPNASPGSGFATVVVDDVANTVFVDLTFAGLTAPASAAHIHCCNGPGVNSPVIIPLSGFPNLVSGSYSNTFATTAGNIAGIEAFGAYLNIHSASFPGGEIRGDLTADTVVTPEPGSVALLGTGLLLILSGRRRFAR